MTAGPRSRDFYTCAEFTPGREPAYNPKRNVESFFISVCLCIANLLSFPFGSHSSTFATMETVNGYEALKTLKEISRAGGRFTIAFFKYSRAKKKATSTLRTIEGCRVRAQLPHERFEIDGDNFFLFEDADGNPKACYKVLIRFIGVPVDNFKLTKVNWFNNE